jgi:inward rectifier potassium channel
MADDVQKAAEEESRDLGFGNQLDGNTARLLNADGSFNVKRRGIGFRHFFLYNYLISISWSRFLLLVFLFFIVLNAFFAFLYLATGIDGLSGLPEGESTFSNFLYCFYFSTQTFTTVGYGAISPQTHTASLIASFEAMVGLLGFAFATGLLYGRFSKPTASILFSDKMLVSPYRDGKDALMFRIVNARRSQLVNLQVKVIANWFEEGSRRYAPLDLERDFVTLFPLNWTIVHPLGEESPIWNIMTRQLKNCDPEFMIIINGYDDNFAQEVHARSSYKRTEMVWGARFVPMYKVEEDGDTVVELDKLSLCQKAELNQLKNS